jgi:phosphoglycerate dehydrogenase-like enzyme
VKIAFMDPLEGRLKDFPKEYLPSHESLRTEEEGKLPEGWQEAEAAVWTHWPVDAELIDGMRNLKFMQRIGYFRGTGDARAALKRGIPVAVTPFGVSDRVAQHAFAHTMALVRQIPASHKAVVEGRNPDNMAEEETGSSATKINWARIPDLRSLNDMTVGILGFGEIGASYARLLTPFCTRTLAYRRRPLSPEQEAHYGVTYAPIDRVLRESDVVVSFVPYSEASRRMLGEAEFRSMKRGAYFVNCGRGNTIDEAALVRVLSEGYLAGAGLDVFSVEPLPMDNPLRKLPNVTLTPHSAGGTPGWTDTFRRLAENLRRVEAGEPVILAMREGDYQPGPGEGRSR